MEEDATVIMKQLEVGRCERKRRHQVFGLNTERMVLLVTEMEKTIVDRAGYGDIISLGWMCSI